MGKFDREAQLFEDIRLAFQEIPIHARFGSYDDQRLQYLCQRVVASLGDSIDDVFDALKLESPIESMMYLRLRDIQLGTFARKVDIDVHPQHVIGPYRVDFLVVHGENKYVIECDGHEFHEKTKAQVEHDKKRDRYLTSSGYKVLHYSGSEIYAGRVDLVADLCIPEVKRFSTANATS